jgi:hypothetical protein
MCKVTEESSQYLAPKIEHGSSAYAPVRSPPSYIERRQNHEAKSPHAIPERGDEQ